MSNTGIINGVQETIGNTTVPNSMSELTQKLAALKLMGQFTSKFIPLEINEQFQNSTPTNEYNSIPTQFNQIPQVQNYPKPLIQPNNQFDPNEFVSGLPPVPSSSEVLGRSQEKLPLTLQGSGVITKNPAEKFPNLTENYQNQIIPDQVVSNPSQNLQLTQTTQQEITEKLPKANKPQGESIIKSFFRKITGINQPDNKENIPTVGKNSDVRSVQENLNTMMGLEIANN